MFTQPKIRSGGIIGEDLKEVWRALLQLRPIPTFNTRLKVTPAGYSRTPIMPPIANTSGIQHAYIIDETQQWLKCQTESQLDTDNYTWVAKPNGLRGEAPPTAASYPDVVWGTPFTGEQFIYRNANERLRKFSLDYAGLVRISLTQILTGYEKWPAQANAADVASYLGANRYTSKLGLVDWIYDFQVIYPTYGTFAPVETSQPAEGWPNVILIAPLASGNLPVEEPDDATFQGPFYQDINVSNRCWISKGIAMPSELAIFNLGGAGVFGASAVWPQQYTDQNHNNTNPQLKSLLPSFWPELQP